MEYIRHRPPIPDATFRTRAEARFGDAKQLREWCEDRDHSGSLPLHAAMALLGLRADGGSYAQIGVFVGLDELTVQVALMEADYEFERLQALNMNVYDLAAALAEMARLQRESPGLAARLWDFATVPPDMPLLPGTSLRRGGTAAVQPPAPGQRGFRKPRLPSSLSIEALVEPPASWTHFVSASRRSLSAPSAADLLHCPLQRKRIIAAAREYDVPDSIECVMGR
jgi:hypothetical protein